MELVAQIQQKLVLLSSPIESIRVSLGNFTEECNNVSELEAFLKDIFLPKVVKEATLTIRANITIFLNLGDSYASYNVENARDTSQARSFEDIILTLFKKHRVSRLASPFSEIFVALSSLMAFLFTMSPLVQSVIQGKLLPYRGFYVFGAICILTLWAYVMWSHYTPDTPSMSFFHSIIWIEQPKTSAKWVFVSTILIGLLVSFLSNLLS